MTEVDLQLIEKDEKCLEKVDESVKGDGGATDLGILTKGSVLLVATHMNLKVGK